MLTPRARSNAFVCLNRNDGLVIDVCGVINAELYLYVDKTRRYAYRSMRLGSFVAHHGLQPKKQYVVTVTNAHDLIAALEYNMHDSVWVAQLWDCTGAMVEVNALIDTFRCHPWDAMRYNTGVMTSCMVAHKLWLRCMRMEWARCDYMEYEGGFVYVPRLGVYDRVDVLDFKSMYPIIMCMLNISPENITVCPSCLSAGGVWSDDAYHAVAFEGRTAMFNRSTTTIMPEERGARCR